MNTALHFDRWGSTLARLSLSPDEGGSSVAPLDAWLQVQAGLAFASFSNNQMGFTPFGDLNFQTVGPQIWGGLEAQGDPVLAAGAGALCCDGFLSPVPKSIFTGQEIRPREHVNKRSPRFVAALAYCNFSKFQSPHLLLPQTHSKRRAHSSGPL